MISKVFSILTLIIAGTAAFLGMKGKEAVDHLQGELSSFKNKYNSEVAAHGKTKDTLKKTQEDLEGTKAELESTKGKLRDTETALVAMTKERDDNKTALGMKEMELAGIKAELEKIGGTGKIEELGRQIADLAAKSKEQEGKIGTLEKEKIELGNAVASLEGQVKTKEEKIAQDTVKIKRWEEHFMQKGTRGRVMAVNPGWGFAVLSIGDKQGAAANKIMIVGRAGQSIGKVKITSVENNQSIADIIPGSFTKGLYVEPGDEVIFTGDDKVKTDVVAGAAPGAGSGLELPNNK